MATLYITEFANIPTSMNAQGIQVAAHPALADQTVTISGSSTASSAFNPKTNFIRLHTDAICSVSFGTAPTATTSKARMPADSTEYYGIPQGQSYKVAAITNT